jgi:hypothetical protein
LSLCETHRMSQLSVIVRESGRSSIREQLR